MVVKTKKETRKHSNFNFEVAQGSALVSSELPFRNVSSFFRWIALLAWTHALAILSVLLASSEVVLWRKGGCTTPSLCLPHMSSMLKPLSIITSSSKRQSRSEIGDCVTDALSEAFPPKPLLMNAASPPGNAPTGTLPACCPV